MEFSSYGLILNTPIISLPIKVKPKIRTAAVKARVAFRKKMVNCRSAKRKSCI
jgi:hypothetical protein